MTKWADYLISAVRYNDKHTHIELLKVYKDFTDTNPIPADPQARTTVIANLKNGITYLTVAINPDGSFRRGEDVRRIIVNDIEYIRTDANKTDSDDLGNLLTF